LGLYGSLPWNVFLKNKNNKIILFSRAYVKTLPIFKSLSLEEKISLIKVGEFKK